MLKADVVASVNRRLAAEDPDRRFYRRVRALYEDRCRVVAEAQLGHVDEDVIRLAAEDLMAMDGIRARKPRFQPPAPNEPDPHAERWHANLVAEAKRRGIQVPS